MRTKLVSKVFMAAALCAGALTVTATSEAAKQCPREGVICTQEYRPVICNDGNVYPNSCYAYVACANGCKNYDEVVTP